MAPEQTISSQGPGTDTTQDGVIIDELLCFLTNKVNSLSTDVITKLCVEFYDEEVIVSSKNRLFELCADENNDRNRRRQGTNKNSDNIKDIIKLIQEKGSNIPTFVAHNLGNLPPIQFDHVDVTVLLSEIKKTQSEVAKLRKCSTAQHDCMKDLLSASGDLSSRVLVLEDYSQSQINSMATGNSLSTRPRPMPTADVNDANPGPINTTPIMSTTNRSTSDGAPFTTQNTTATPTRQVTRPTTVHDTTGRTDDSDDETIRMRPNSAETSATEENAAANPATSTTSHTTSAMTSRTNDETTRGEISDADPTVRSIGSDSPATTTTGTTTAAPIAYNVAVRTGNTQAAQGLTTSTAPACATGNSSTVQGQWFRVHSAKGKTRHIPEGEQNLNGGAGTTNKVRSSATVQIQPRSFRQQGIKGKNKSTGIRTVKRVQRPRIAKVFATGFKPGVTAADLKEYLSNQLCLDMDVEPVIPRSDRPTYVSFRINCECPNPTVFMDEELWPEEASVYWWREPRVPVPTSEDSTTTVTHPPNNS